MVIRKHEDVGAPEMRRQLMLRFDIGQADTFVSTEQAIDMVVECVRLASVRSSVRVWIAFQCLMKSRDEFERTLRFHHLTCVDEAH